MCGFNFRRWAFFHRLFPVFLLTYLLLLMFLLLKVHVEIPRDSSDNFQTPSAFVFSANEMRLQLFSNQTHEHGSRITGKFPTNEIDRVVNDKHAGVPKSDSQKDSKPFLGNAAIMFPGKEELNFQEPRPIAIPSVNGFQTKEFYTLHDEVFVYSAYYDDRKDEHFIRLLILASQTASGKTIFCYFNDEIFSVTRKAIRYEMCENHSRKFGGYIFSCQVPEFLSRPMSSQVNVSYGSFKKNLIIPLMKIRPSEVKLSYLDSYIGNSRATQSTTSTENKNFNHDNDNNNKNKNDNTSYHNKISKNNISHHIAPQDKVISFGDGVAGRQTSSKNPNAKDRDSITRIPYLSFAVCVPPLFGQISPHRLIEFVELTLLLGSDHIFFYNYSISDDDVSKVLFHYVHGGRVTVTPWSLPSNVTSDKVWYNGQLLAHNDCLYRSMPHFDLVAFNDVDEFIIPRHNDSMTWSRAFPKLLSNNTCGFSFQSAFFDPGVKNMADPDLLTPKLMSRTRKLSKVRSKVMLCPWRVFEVGIHHISKQNREKWTVSSIEPTTAFLHHYRQCVVNYDMACNNFQRDDTVALKYHYALKKKYDETVASLFPRKEDKKEDITSFRSNGL